MENFHKNNIKFNDRDVQTLNNRALYESPQWSNTDSDTVTVIGQSSLIITLDSTTTNPGDSRHLNNAASSSRGSLSAFFSLGLVLILKKLFNLAWITIFIFISKRKRFIFKTIIVIQSYFIDHFNKKSFKREFLISSNKIKLYSL